MYLTFKALHLISMVTWFAGLFYMFRLFVYIVENKDNISTRSTLMTMAHRLYFYITWPSMVVTVICGLTLITQVPYLMQAGWFHVKLFLLVGLISYHFYIGYVLNKFKSENFYLTSRQCRIRNEYPTLFLVLIVLLAVFKPF